MQGLMRVLVLSWAGVAAGIAFQAAAQRMPAPIVNPPGVRLHLDITDTGPFREMQIIRGVIELDRQPGSASADGGEPMWSHSGYLVDPPLSAGVRRCGTLQQPCIRQTPGHIEQGHFWGGDVSGQEGPQPIRITEKLPPLAPGNYRIAAVATRHQVYQGAAAPAPTPAPRAPELAVSNWVPLTILPASEDWIRQTLSQTSPSAEAPIAEGPEAHRAWLDRIHQLTLLDHPAAWEAIASLQLRSNFLNLGNLSSTRRPEQACAWMRQGLDDAQRRVDSWYLHTTTVVCGRAELPPSPTVENPGTPLSPEVLTLLRAHSERHQQWYLQQVESNGSRLLASLPRREGQVLADALTALLGFVPSAQQQAQLAQVAGSGRVQAGVAFARSSRFFFGPPTASGAEPSWASQFRQDLPKRVGALDPALRAHVLERVANQFESPEWAPVLEAELRQLGPKDGAGAVRHLLYSLAALDSQRAASLIAAELRKQETWLSPEMLTLLPTEPKPFTDSQLVEMLANHGAVGSDKTIWQAAVARFASPEAAPRIREIFDQRSPACQEALVGYFVRADPDFAASILGSNWDMRGTPKRCKMEYLSRTAGYGTGAVLEKFLTAHLFHSQVPLKQAAAQSLQMHGSPAAQEALWEALRHFRQYWKGREEELKVNFEGQQFERMLAHALMTARHWTLASEGIQTVRDLCTGAQCQQATVNFLGMWRRPLMINALKSQGRFHGQVAQYSCASPDELLTRIKQIPAGTRIRLNASGPDSDTLRQSILAQAASAGLIVDY